MKILVTGSTGLVGAALVPFLSANGHEVVQLVRRRPVPSGAAYWNPEAGEIDPGSLDGFDAAVHLAGENLAAGRWTVKQKERIRSSREKGTRLLSETLGGLARPPRVLVAASAIGYYGDRGDQVLTEASSLGSGFLSEVCRLWEAATEPAARKGIRVANLRLGFILSPAGGGLARMLTPFKLGLGGTIGGGRQYLSWVAIDDVVGALHHALVTESLAGPVNLVAPNPVTNRQFTETLGRVLGRHTPFPVPALVARLAFGQMAEEVLLASQRVDSTKLRTSGYRFHFPELEGALRHILRQLP